MRTARELHDARQRLGLKAADLARKTRVPIEQIVAIESGEPEVLPAPDLLKKLLPALAAELGLDGSSLRRRYLLELHYLTAPELATRAEPEDTPVTQPLRDPRPAPETDDRGETDAFGSEPAEELALAAGPSRPVVPDLPLYAGIPDCPAAPPQPSAPPSRGAGHRGLAMLVSAGFFAGLLLSAAFSRGTPPPQAAAQSARNSDAPPEIASPDRRERPADADAAAPAEAPPLASPDARPPAIVSSTNATRTGSAPADPRGSTPAQPAAPATQAAARQPGSAAPGDSPGPQTRTARAVAETNAPADLSGAWLVTNRVDSTSYRAFQNLRIGYRLRLTQRGNRIVGDGRKWVEDGQPLPQSRRTPIAVEGTLDGRWLELRFVESGARRASAGAFVMLVVDERTLQGTFTSNAANSSGSAVATRDTGKGL